MDYFTVEDYLEVYYKDYVVSCIEIGMYLLSKLDDETSKDLFKKLQKINYSWDLSKDELYKINLLLAEVKRWLISSYDIK